MPVLPDAPVTRAKFQDFRGEVHGEFASVRGEIAAFRSEFLDFQARLFQHLGGVDRRLDGVERRLDGVDERFADQNVHFDKIYSKLTLLTDEYQSIKVGLMRVEDAVNNRRRKPRR